MRSIARRHGLGRGTATAKEAAAELPWTGSMAATISRKAGIGTMRATTGRRSVVFICVGVSCVVCLHLHVVFVVVLVCVYLFVYVGFCLYGCVFVVWLVCVYVMVFIFVCVVVLLVCVYMCMFVAWLVCVYIVLAELSTGAGRSRARNRGGKHTHQGQQQGALQMMTSVLASQGQQQRLAMNAAFLYINNYDGLVLLVCLVGWCV
jgi:hypothetical protein